MRAFWKLSAILAIALGAQWLIERRVGDLDEAQFAVRAMVWHWLDRPSNDPEILAACHRLYERHWERLALERRAQRMRYAASAAGTPVPVELEPVCETSSVKDMINARPVQRSPRHAHDAAQAALAAPECWCFD